MGHFHAPPNMVDNLVELLSQVHIRLCSPHAAQPSISIIFITATLGQHLRRHYPRLKPNLQQQHQSDRQQVCTFSQSFLNNQIN